MNWLEILGWEKKELNDLKYLAYSYAQQGKYDIAIKIFKALNILEKENSYNIQMLGALHLEIEENKKALNYLNIALKFTPNHLPSLLNKAKALLYLGYKKEGLSLAKNLTKSENKDIASQSEALILAYS
ncbi:MAG: type III secretion chaperone [Chlamydiae bacterium SM23_39]|nr:MAG: type III secretion chaperone [Chlamydiae bacterium SM23_39]